MVKAGWAASFPIYPSIPKHKDLAMLHEAAEEAFRSKRGIWTEPMTLTGYEFRMAVKLYDVTQKLVAGETLSSYQRKGWVTRYCADMTTHEIFYPECSVCHDPVRIADLCGEGEFTGLARRPVDGPVTQ